MRKIIPFVCLGVIIISFLIGIIFFTKTVEINILTYLRNYNVASTIEEDDYINISFFINDKNSYILDKSQFEYASVTSLDDSESMKLDLISVISKEESLEYNDDKYYMFILNFKILFDVKDEYNWNLSDAYLNIGYQGNKDYKIKIGKFSFNKYIKSESLISISSIKPLTFENDNSYLGGVIYGIKNNSNKPISINKIEILNTNAHIGDGIKEIENINSIDFEEVAGYSHDQVKKRINDLNIIIDSQKEKKIFVPIYYDELFIMRRFPIKINYLCNDKTYDYTFGLYNYYNPIKEVVKKNNYMVYKVK